MTPTPSLMDRITRQLYAALQATPPAVVLPPPAPVPPRTLALVRTRPEAPVPHQHTWGLTRGPLACVECAAPYAAVLHPRSLEDAL